MPALPSFSLGGRIVAEDGTPLATGAEEVKALYDQSTRIYPQTGTPLSKHVVTNPIVEIDEDAGTATCRSYYTVLQKTDLLDLQPIITGRYHDTFTRHPDGWFFTERKMIMDQLGDLSQHLLIGSGISESAKRSWQAEQLENRPG